MNSRTLTILPAKLGSTRLPQKNILPLGDKPLIAWSIEAARQSSACGRIMVSSESKKVLDIAEEYGAEVPFVRPDHLARDPYGVSDVCLNVLEAYEQLGQTFDTLIILLPTSPFRTAEDIDAAYALFRENNANYLMSVSEYEHSPYSALRMASQFPHQAFPCFPETLGKKRHEMPVPYRANGAICIVDVKAFKQSRSYYGTPLHVYAMPQSRSIDIDSALDFELAQWLLTKRVSND